MTADRTQISRRRFLKLAGAAGAVSIPALVGYSLLHEASGEAPPNGSPFALIDMLDTWPQDPAAASPILLLTQENADNPFGLYLAEILRGEGLNCFQVARVDELDRAPLPWYDLVLLAEGPVSQHQAELLEGYVAQGGRLVAMRPDRRLTHLFGVEQQVGSLTEGYLQVDRGQAIAQGIASETMQFHGKADLYRPAGAQVVAWLASDADTKTASPALAVHRYGEGQAALWAFDLARSVAYTRQGNPAWADQERDGLPGIRVTDMLAGWVDLDRLPIPQADEQQRLLANLLSALSQDARPLPRLWYFPGAAGSVLVVTGDSHGNPPSAIEEALTRVEQRGGHMSIYYTAYPSSDLRRAARRALFPVSGLPVIGEIVTRELSSPTPTQVASWRQRGHEFALHPYVEEGLDAGWHRYWEEFTGMGYGPVPPTTRTHQVLWQGWVETARIQASYGIRLNLDPYHLGPFFRNRAGEWTYGYFTGSSLPMKFVDEQGQVLNIYQQPTLLADEHLLSLPWVTGQVPALTAEEAVEVSRTLLRHSLDGAYSALTAQFHLDPFAIGGQAGADEARWLEGTLDYAAAQGVPIWSAWEWLRFTKTRHDTSLVDLQWNADQKRLRFALTAPEDPDAELAVMLPLRHGDAALVQVDLDGLTAQHQVREVGGVSYGWIATPAGSHQVAATYS